MILVTGASGYLGSHVVTRLTETDVAHACTGSYWDLTKPDTASDLIRAIRPDRIIHCAANVPKLGAAYNDSPAAKASLAMVQNLALCAECPITFASSMTAADPTTEYAYHKLLAERAIKERGVSGDVVIRLPGLFGAPRRTGVLYNAAHAFLAGRPFVLDAIPSAWAAMDVRDAAGCMVTGVYTGPTEPMDIRAVVDLIAFAAGATDWVSPFPVSAYPPGFYGAVCGLVDWVRSTTPTEIT